MYTEPAYGGAAGRYQRVSLDQLGHVRRTTATVHDLPMQVGLRRAAHRHHRKSLLPPGRLGRNGSLLSTLRLDDSLYCCIRSQYA